MAAPSTAAVNHENMIAAMYPHKQEQDVGNTRGTKEILQQGMNHQVPPRHEYGAKLFGYSKDSGEAAAAIAAKHTNKAEAFCVFENIAWCSLQVAKWY